MRIPRMVQNLPIVRRQAISPGKHDHATVRITLRRFSGHISRRCCLLCRIIRPILRDVAEGGLLIPLKSPRRPYKFWRHTHRFSETDGGTSIVDMVAYALPFGPFGRLVHRLQVLFLMAVRQPSPPLCEWVTRMPGPILLNSAETASVFTCGPRFALLHSSEGAIVRGQHICCRVVRVHAYGSY
jgi:hypothetical protein